MLFFTHPFMIRDTNKANIKNENPTPFTLAIYG